jgi:transcription elongation GreA/GreB family factor
LRPVVLDKDGAELDKRRDSHFHSRVNKRELVQAIIDRLQEDLEIYHKAALAARAEATHEQSKAEHKYDTRGLEASYLARGQSRQAADIEQAIIDFRKLATRDFGQGEGVALGAIVELKGKGERSTYFLGPKAGGTEVTFGEKEVLVITPESPLGSQLISKKQGDKCRLEIGGQKQDYTVALVI